MIRTWQLIHVSHDYGKVILNSDIISDKISFKIFCLNQKNISECFAKLCCVVIVAMFVVTTALIPLMIFLFTFMCSLCCKSILHHKKLNCQKTIFCHTCFSCLTEKTVNRCFWNIRIIVTTVFRINSFQIFHNF